MRRQSDLLLPFLFSGVFLSAVLSSGAWAAEGGVLLAAKSKKKRAAPAVEEAADAGDEGGGGPQWFPDWPTGEFDWSIDPIVGARYSAYSSGDTRVETNTLELGLGLGVQNIPLAPGNPGYATGLEGGVAFGQVREKTRVADTSDTVNYKYQRQWATWNNTFYAKHYKHELSLGIGKKVIKTDPQQEVFSNRIVNDFGLLVLSWLSSHLTWDYIKAYGESSSKPFLEEHDLWLHARMFTSFLEMFWDVGPGFTLVDEYTNDPNNYTKLGRGRTDYFKMMMGMRLVWKIGMFVHAKYVFASSEDALGNYARVGLPDQNVYAPSQLAMPDDSLYTLVFFGIRNLMGGLGVGWYQNTEIYHASDAEKKEVERSQGFGVMYEAAF